LHTRNINEVGLWGFSLGGAVALMTAPLAPEVKAIVAESSYASLDLMLYDYYPIPFIKYPLGELTRLWAWLFLRLDIRTVSPVLAAEKIQIPVLLIHSKKDRVIPFKNALLLQKALSRNPHAKVIFMEEGLHGEHFMNYDASIEAFYDNYLESKR
jgi:dipeptidyl aminopeptidase/acylaminoacyl peptidase